MADNADMVQVLGESMPRARKEHKCQECGRVIQRGEIYKSESTLFDGMFNIHRTCPQCVVAREWLLKQCHGFLYGGIEEDLEEHLQDYTIPPHVRFGIARLVVGMRTQWRFKKMPRLPLTSHEIAPTPAPEEDTCTVPFVGMKRKR